MVNSCNLTKIVKYFLLQSITKYFSKISNIQQNYKEINILYNTTELEYTGSNKTNTKNSFV